MQTRLMVDPLEMSLLQSDLFGSTCQLFIPYSISLGSKVENNFSTFTYFDKEAIAYGDKERHISISPEEELSSN